MRLIKNSFVVVVLSGLSACSAGDFTCKTEFCNAANGVAMVNDIYHQNPKKCADKTQAQRQACEAQVKAINNSIKKQQQ